MKLTHSQLEKFVNDTLSKREPCPAMVLAWGWLLKQGEGGLLHNDSFKQRFFVLARVPHATVLIYYGEKTMDEENILGYIDLRRVTAVREGQKTVNLDGSKSAASALVGRMKGMFGSTTVSGSMHPVVELVTAGRTFVLAPARIQMPPPMTTSMALGPNSCGRPLYLFGWPFPVPSLDAEEGEAEEVSSGIVEGRVNSDAFAQWRDVLATAVASEKATKAFPVVVLVDSTAQLPQKVLLRTTPCEIAIISIDDKDSCHNAVPYNDLLKWEVQVDTELHVTARTRARLIARADRGGFTSQRPTRPTCHFVFKSAVAKSIVTVIDNHLRALHKQLAGLEGEVEEEEFVGDLGDAEVGPGTEALEEEGAAAARKKLTGKKAAPMPAGDYEDEEEPSKPKPAATYGSGAASGSKKKSMVSRKKVEDSDSEDSLPRRKKASKKKSSDSEDETDSEAERKKKSKRKIVDSDEDSEEERKKKKSASKRKVVDSDDEDSDEKPKKSKKKVVESEDDSEEEERKRKASRKKKVVEDSD